MSKESEVSPADLAWAESVWFQCQRWECEGLLYAALAFSSARPAPASSYVEQMALLPWRDLGHALQNDLARQFRRLQRYLGPGSAALLVQPGR